MNLILLEERDRVDSSSVTLSDARAAHLLNVLRVTPGQTVRSGCSMVRLAWEPWSSHVMDA